MFYIHQVLFIGPLEDIPSDGEDHSDDTRKKVWKNSELTINWMYDYDNDDNDDNK